MKEPKRRGPKGYKLATRIAILALVVLSGMSYDRALRLISVTKIYRRLGADRVPSKSTITRWKASLKPYVRLLIRKTFLMLAQGRLRLLAVVDGTGFKLGRASGHYLRRLRRKTPYLRSRWSTLPRPTPSSTWSSWTTLRAS